MRRVAKAQAPPLEIRQAELGQPRSYGDSYGQVTVSVTLDCRIDELINLLAALSAQPEIIATDEIRFGMAHPKQKTMPVRLTVSGIVAHRLVPKRRNAAALTRKLRLLDVALVAVLALLGVQMRHEWMGAHAREQALLHSGRSRLRPELWRRCRRFSPLAATSYADVAR